MSPFTVFIIVVAVIVVAGIAAFIAHMAKYSADDSGEESEAAAEPDDIIAAEAAAARESEPRDDALVIDMDELRETPEDEGFFLEMSSMFADDDEEEYYAEDEYMDEMNLSGAPDGEAAETERPAPVIDYTVPDWASDGDGYEILRSGTFRLKGTTVNDGRTEPVEIAVTEDTSYMSTLLDGVVVGMLLSDGRVFLISDEKQMYLELSQLLMRTMGVSPEEMSVFGSSTFSDLPPISEAEEANETEIDGRACTEYVFPDNGGFRKLWLDGNTLLRYSSYDSDGAMKACINVIAIGGDVPEDLRAPNSEYKKLSGMMGAARFISAVAPKRNG